MIFVSDNYKQQLQEFDQIKNTTHEVIRESSTKMDLMKIWKNRIRTTLIKVRNDFVGWIDSFTNQFINSLKTVDGHGELADLGGFMIDATMRRLLEEMKESYVKIMLIFEDITRQSIQEKIEKIEETKANIKAIEAQVAEQERNFKGLVDKVLKAQDKTVSLDALGEKIEVKFMRHFQKKLAGGKALDVGGVSML